MMRPDRFLWPWRERILAGALAIAAVVGFVVVRHATDAAARRQAQQHAQLVALQVESNAARAVAYVDAIRGYLVSHPTVSEAGFSSFALGILGLAGLHEAAWVEPVAGARRARYEASAGRPITEPSGRPLGRAPAGGPYYPATLITQVLSSDVPGVDLGAYPRLHSVLAGSEALFAVVATAPAQLPGGSGVFFATAAPRNEQRGRVPGFVVVSAPLEWLEGSFANSPGGVEIRVGGGTAEALKSGRGAISQSFPAAARRWSVLVPGGRPSSTADALAWSSLGGGLALAALTLLLGAKRGQAEEERRAQLWFLESLDRINRAIQSTSDFEQMLGAVLDVVLAIFNCDRAWLAYPCDPEVTSLRVLLQRTRQQGLAALALDAEIPKDPELAGVVRAVLASDSPVRFDPDSRHASPSMLRDLFSVRSMIAMAVYPKRDKPYMFALHQCSHRRIWTPPEERLFQEIGRRLADALDPVLMFRDLRESERKIEKSRAEVERLAEEQAALRRVATLVGQGATPSAVFDAVAAEMAALLNADGITLCRYEPGEELTVLAHLGPEARQLPAGRRVPHDGKSVSATVRRTNRPARMDSYADTHGQIGELIDGLGFRSGVGTPIVVEGRLWGTAIANWTGEERPPEDTEERMAKFTQLLETAIANADSHDQLTASRARLVTEADEARRRVVRDLHDGAQQRFVHTIIRLKLAHRALRNGSDDAESLVGEALTAAEQGNEELRELAHGILPGALTQGGLQAGVATVVARLELPVEVDVPAERFPAAIEASAYFVVAEALTNVVKHAHATRAEVRGTMQDGMLHIEVRDDGIGGVDPDGHGLVGMGDRVTALGGTLQIQSPPGGGTLVIATLPLEDGVR
jgi:signal transduction histidine kinase